MPRQETLQVTSPFDGEVIGELPRSDAGDVEAALARAAALFEDRAGWLTLAARVEILSRTADLLAAAHDEFSMLIAQEGGKPLRDAQVETTRAVDGIHIAIESMRTHAGEVIPFGATPFSRQRLGFTRKEPIGPVVAVSAFNHPLNLIVHQVVPAVAAGCPVIVKPSEDTPLCCERFVALLHAAGLPESWAQTIITDELSVAEKLVTDPRVAFFSFIGSARVGWMLRGKLAAGARCALEHGGVAPVVLTGGVDHAAAVRSLVKGGFYHAGQVCVSVQRVFVPAEEARAFATALAAAADGLVVGDATLPETEVGPLIRPREVVRVAEWVDEAVAAGAEVLCGGSALGETLYAPTVLLDPPADARVSTQEVFGPVVCVYGYDDVADAVRQANALPYAFQAAVFTPHIDEAMDLAGQLAASAVMINDHTAFRVDGMPFAGLRQSGLGVGGIPYTLEDMQVDKMVVVHSPSV